MGHAFVCNTYMLERLPAYSCQRLLTGSGNVIDPVASMLQMCDGTVCHVVTLLTLYRNLRVHVSWHAFVCNTYMLERLPAYSCQRLLTGSGNVIDPAASMLQMCDGTVCHVVTLLTLYRNLRVHVSWHAFVCNTY